MFQNPGGKLKLWAQFIAFAGIAFSVVFGLIVLTGNAYVGHFLGKAMVWSGLLIMAGGSLLSWLASLILYGFGEIVEHVEKPAEASENAEAPVWAEEEAQQPAQDEAKETAEEPSGEPKDEKDKPE